MRLRSGAARSGHGQGLQVRNFLRNFPGRRGDPHDPGLARRRGVCCPTVGAGQGHSRHGDIRGTAGRPLYLHVAAASRSNPNKNRKAPPQHGLGSTGAKRVRRGRLMGLHSRRRPADSSRLSAPARLRLGSALARYRNGYDCDCCAAAPAVSVGVRAGSSGGPRDAAPIPSRLRGPSG